MTDTQTLERRIGASVEDELFDALWRLVSGEIELHELSDALQAWWTIAHSDGYAAGAFHINARAEHEADLWYWVANNPGKRPGDYGKYRTQLLWEAADRGEADL